MGKIKFNENERFRAFKFTVDTERFNNILNSNRGYSYSKELTFDIADYLYRQLADKLSLSRKAIGSVFSIGINDTDAKYLGLDEIIEWIEQNDIKNIDCIMFDRCMFYIIFEG
jgi:hypothetical protein